MIFRPHPKSPRLESPHLLLMAREVLRPCLLRSPQCWTLGSPTNCCACHGNSSIYGKGRGIKAHDFFTVWGCARCHTWLDESYIASNEDRQLYFSTALTRQVIAWKHIALDPASPKKDAAAAAWAVNNLKERGYA